MNAVARAQLTFQILTKQTKISVLPEVVFQNMGQKSNGALPGLAFSL